MNSSDAPYSSGEAADHRHVEQQRAASRIIVTWM